MKFLNLLNLRKINKEYESYLKNSNWDSPKNLKIEYTHFAPIHAVGYGLNGDSELVEFQTKLIESDFIYFDRRFDSNSNYMQVYLRSTGKAESYNGRNTYFEFKNKKNKRIVRTNINADFLKSNFGYEPLPLEIKTRDDQGNIKIETVDRWNEVYRDNVDAYYNDLADIRYSREKFEKFLESKGWRLIRAFEYDTEFSIHPKYFKALKNSIEIGWNTFGTYCSHPNVLKIIKTKEVKRIKLETIGAESAGYYDHHTKMYIRPEQVKQVKAFAKKFKRSAAKGRV